MTVEVITKDDLKTLKHEIITELKTVLNGKNEQKSWLRSSDLCEMLSISSSALQTLRTNGTLPYTRIGKTLYYEYVEVVNILQSNKSIRETEI